MFEILSVFTEQSFMTATCWWEEKWQPIYKVLHFLSDFQFKGFLGGENSTTEPPKHPAKLGIPIFYIQKHTTLYKRQLMKHINSFV